MMDDTLERLVAFWQQCVRDYEGNILRYPDDQVLKEQLEHAKNSLADAISYRDRKKGNNND